MDFNTNLFFQQVYAFYPFLNLSLKCLKCMKLVWDLLYVPCTVQKDEES